MDLDLTPEQQHLVDALNGFLAARCPPDAVRASEPGGFDRDLWIGLADLAGPTIGIPEDRGGGGAGLEDLVLVSERLGHFLAPVPFIEGAVTARLLGTAGQAAEPVLKAMTGNPATVGTIALHPAVEGTARSVPSGSVAGAVVALDVDDLVLLVDQPGGVGPANLGSSPLADRSVRSAGRAVLASGPPARRAFEQAVDEWRVLMSGALVGLGEAALGLGVEYAKHRHQFERPIGSFQSVARDLADVATAIDGARLLSREAAWARDEDEPEFRSLAAMAFLFATRAARRASNVALHVHGGYGFTLEYDIQLYYRRAEAWPLALGDPRRGVAGLADALFGPAQVA